MKNNILTAAFAILLIAGIGIGINYLSKQAKSPLGANIQEAANGIQQKEQSAQINEKAYVAIEGTGEIAVINTQSKTVIKKIDLTDHSHSAHGSVAYMPHNVQVAPNGKSVWVAANAMSAASHNEKQSVLPFVKTARADEGHGNEAPSDDDQLIIIDPETDTIVKRISVGKGLHLAHVVLSPDSSFALATAQGTGAIYKINTATFEVEKNISATEGSAPHGLRISPDGKTAYIAMVKGKSIGVLDIEKFALNYIALDGAAVQTGVTPDGKYAVASVYNTKKLAVYNTQNKKLSYVALPSEANGPVQMYPTPDSRFIYMVDQGYYFNQPTSEVVYKIDLVEMKVVKSIKAGKAPHGIVVSKTGKFAYVTNLLSGDVSVIDTATDTEISKIEIGKEPNGISLWSKALGGTQ